MFTAIVNSLRQLYERILKVEVIRRIVANASFMSASTVFAAAMGMVKSALTINLLGPAAYGLLAAVEAFTNTIDRLVSFRINEMVVRYMRLYLERGQQEKAAAVYKIAAIFELASAAVGFGLIYFLAPLGVENFADDPNTPTIWFVAYGLVIIFNLIYDTSRGLLEVYTRFKGIAAINASQSGISLLLLGIVFLSGGSFFAVLMVSVVQKFINAAAMTGLALRVAHQEWGRGWWKVSLSVLKEDRRSLFVFAFSTNLNSTISLVAKETEGLWVNGFLGNLMGGYYRIAMDLIGFLQIPLAPFASVTYPELSQAVAKKDWPNLLYILRRSSTLAAAISIPVALGLAVFGQWLIRIYASVESLPAYPALMILMIGYTFANILFWNRVALLALNRPVFPTIINFTGMVLRVIGIFIFVPTYGYLAFAALLSAYFLFTVGVTAGTVVMDVRRKVALSAAPA